MCRSIESLTDSKDYEIWLDRVSKTFCGPRFQIPTVLDLSLGIKKQEFVSLVGPSGCGKSTILRMIGDLTDPSSGQIAVNGLTPRAARQQRYFGFVFQEPVLLPWRTALQNIGLPGEVLKDRLIAERVRELVGLVGLRDFEDFFPSQLSGGMKSRVAIARALSFEPRILLMDEPFASLDELMRARLNFELLRIWHRVGKTILFVSHSISEAVLLSDRVVVLTRRPARVKAVIEVDLPRPRTRDIRRTVRFNELVEHLRSSLDDELNEQI